MQGKRNRKSPDLLHLCDAYPAVLREGRNPAESKMSDAGRLKVMKRDYFVLKLKKIEKVVDFFPVL